VSVVQVAADAFGSALGYGLADAMQQTPEPAAQYNIAYGMQSGVGLKADAGVLGAGIGSGYGEYQAADLSLTADGVPGLSMQVGDATSAAYNPAADPEVQAQAQRFLAMNPTAANGVTDPSQPAVMVDSGQYGFPIPNLDDYPDRVLPTYVVTPDPKVIATEAQQGPGLDGTMPSPVDASPLTVVGRGADDGLRQNTGTISYPVITPDVEVTPLSGIDPRLSTYGMQAEPSLLQRFGTGMLGAFESVTIEPIRQVGDLGKAGASVFYNELLRKPGVPYWFPELRSNTATAYADGASQTRLLLGSIPLINAGVALSDARDAWIQGRYGDVAEIAGGMTGGLAIGAGVGKYGGYGLALEDIGATGLRKSQAGSVGLKLVIPEADTEGPFSPIVVGGGLAAHEAAGGHLLLKHVGQTEPQLLKRLVNEPSIKGSSSFYDRATAESAISQTLVLRRNDIDTWLTGSVKQLEINHSLQENIGITLSRDTNTSVDTANLKLILRRDPNMPFGYRIHTGFPTP
jgi:hypothetical protein